MNLSRPFVNGLLIAVPTALAFAVLAVFALDAESAVAQFDLEMAQTMRRFSQQEQYVGYFMIALTVIGGVPFMTGVALGGAAAQYLRKKRSLAAAWVLIPLLGAFLNLGLKVSLNRERPAPDLRDPFVDETNQSFPSGHAMGAAIGWGVVGYMVWREVTSRGKRALLVAGLVLLIMGIGLSRVYLRAHWFSDVIGGFLIGTAWLALCLGIMERARQRERNGTEESIVV